MKKRKKIWIAAALCMLSVCMGGCGSKSASVEAIVQGEGQSVARARYDAITEGVRYISYSVYEELSEKEMEDVGRAKYEEIANSMSDQDVFNKCSIAWYEDDSDTLLYAFEYGKNGVETDAENAYYVPGNRFQLFDPKV